MLRAAALALVACLAAAAPAAADSTFSYNAGTVTIAADAGGADQLTLVTLAGGSTRFQMGGGEAFRQVNADPSVCGPAAPVATITCSAAVTHVAVSLGDGADRVDVSALGPVPATLDITFGPGTDIARLLGATGATVVRGGDGDDFLEGGPAADVLQAGAGDDTLAMSAGADDLSGGDGADALSTAPGAPAIVASLDDAANDGQGANVRSDVEDISGAEAADRVTGSARANILDGGAGGDVLDGRGGHDVYRAGEGDDLLRARDGLAELVACGEGTDVAEVDDVDLVSECETVRASSELRPDVDGDGARKPGDCNDGSAAVRPGAPDVPDNGVDENCDGADATDLDRDDDGFPRPGDCDDNRRSVRPGGREVPGNKVDEDCNGIAAPFARLLAGVELSTVTRGGRARVVRFVVIELRGGERIDVRCEGRGCPFAFRSRTARKRGTLSLRAPFAKARLHPGAVVTVRITRKDGVAKELAARVRERDVRQVPGCITPPRRTAVRC